MPFWLSVSYIGKMKHFFYMNSGILTQGECVNHRPMTIKHGPKTPNIDTSTRQEYFSLIPTSLPIKYNHCVFAVCICIKYANTQLIWSTDIVAIKQHKAVFDSFNHQGQGPGQVLGQNYSEVYFTDKPLPHRLFCVSMIKFCQGIRKLQPT